MAATTDTAQAPHTDGSPDEIMDEPPSGSISPVDPPTSDDFPMDKPFPASEPGSSPSSADPRPTMADVLGQQEHFRRDHAEADAARRRVENPKPLASDIEWIERQNAAGGDWSFIASRIDQARPYALHRAKYDMVIATGRMFAKTPLQKIMVSLSGTHHGNASLEDLYRSHEIGQISKLPEGDLRIKVKSKEACLRFDRTKVNILVGVYTFKEFDVLGGKYFIDISSMDSDTDTRLILQRLFLLGYKPVYDTFRELNLATGITSATWRVYFLTASCPSALIVNGSSERLPFGYHSHHGLDLGTTTSNSRGTVPGSATHQRQNLTTPAQSYEHAVKVPEDAVTMKFPKKTSRQKSVKDAKKREVHLRHGAQHAKTSADTRLVTTSSSISEALSISTLCGSHGKITPPGSEMLRRHPLFC
uniref:Uncharacterized protein n=1 Tax=Peronospora matthiolae TaxID=2874970 RepID=A0AAV1UCG1_9STRA